MKQNKDHAVVYGQLGKQFVRYLRGLLPLRFGDVYVESGAGEFALEPPFFVAGDEPEDMVRAAKPVWAEIKGDFRPRGGIGTVVIARYPRPKK